MKIKIFRCGQIDDTHLKAIEEDVNDFVSTHNTIDIKVNCSSNNYGTVLIYTVLYRGE